MTQATPLERAEGLVHEYLDRRLESANEPPGLRGALVDLIVGQLDNIRSRGGHQIGQLRSPSTRRIPDAYLADEEAIENALQAGGAGIRTARAAEGLLSVDPRRFEDDLARAIAPNARWSMRAEASRVPRPSTRHAALDWSLAPIPWIETDSEWPPSGAVTLADNGQLVGADGDPVRVLEQPYTNWVQLGMFERQRTLGTRFPEVPARQVVIAVGLEVCNDPLPAGRTPLAAAPPNAWVDAYHRLRPGLDPLSARTFLSRATGPLAAIIDYRSELGRPAPDHGAGLHPFELVPRLEVIALLGLRPETPALRHVLVDDDGPALVGRLWHGFLIHDGNYDPLEPAVHGADLLLRPDLYDILERVVGEDRLILGLTVGHSERRTPIDEREPEG